MAGVSLYVVEDLLEHSSITVTERYAHLARRVWGDCATVVADGLGSNIMILRLCGSGRLGRGQ